jgi:hypothetical protein
LGPRVCYLNGDVAFLKLTKQRAIEERTFVGRVLYSMMISSAPE